MDTDLQLCEERGNLWRVMRGGDTLALISLDYKLQTDSVALRESIAPEDRLTVLRLVLSHAMQYYRGRPDVSMYALGIYGRPLYAPDQDAREVSPMVMNFAVIPPVVMVASEPVVRGALSAWKVSIFDDADLRKPQDIVRHILQDFPGVSCHLTEPESDVWTLYFSVTGNVFACWKEFASSETIPADYPFNYGRRPFLAVNGATNASLLPDGVCLEYIYPPQGSSTDGVGWLNMRHPYCASGPGQAVTVSVGGLRSPRGEQELRQFLAAALWRSDRFVAVRQFGPNKH